MRVDDSSAAAPALGVTKAEPAPRDEFLKLLVAQLEHQNPLDPQSGAEFVAQLAQFATVEQGAQTNALLDSMQGQQAASANLAVANFVGKPITATASTLRVDDATGVIPEFSADLAGAAKSVEFVVKDEGGKVVRTIELGPHAAGKVAIPWDGTDSQGVPLPKGNYTVEMQAAGADGDAVSATVELSGVINAVEFKGGQPILRIGGVAILPGDVTSIG